jgi:CheY-like chemotaxis protein
MKSKWMNRLLSSRMFKSLFQQSDKQLDAAAITRSEVLNILMNEDVAADAELVKHELAKGGFNFHFKRVDTREEFEEEIKRRTPDVILSDHGLPAFDGFAAVALARERCPDVPFIFVTGASGEEITIEAFESGVTDYVLKDRLSRLVPVVRRALKAAEATRRRRLVEIEPERPFQGQNSSPRSIKIPKNLLSICCDCKKIRDDNHQWKKLEVFLQEHFNVMFTHGFCPDCFERLRSELKKRDRFRHST